MPGFPRDPLITRHPAPLTARQAREEVRDARGLRRRVPAGHPYGVLPLWIPYGLARLVSALVERHRPTPSVRLRAVPLPPEPKPRARISRQQFAQRWSEPVSPSA
jgi:hypothetical protein